MSYEVQKRILDILVAAILIILFTPFWIVIPILILIDSGRPVFYKHQRLGRSGKEFSLWKFRSMVQDADQILHQQDSDLLKKFKEGDWKFKADEDPRITKLGKIMRAVTIDEFPQLLNVLLGDMSMVGPRAYLEEELEAQTEKYPETKRYLKEILSVKPGITGPWQVSGRNEIPFDDRARLDAEYAHSRSIWLDIKILLRTPRAMLSKW